ncbi:MAG: hypothetical protein NTY19_04425 [Planctomycetota bacterium]|nr:hypothetical protein [Planctomycetota bacterium]
MGQRRVAGRLPRRRNRSRPADACPGADPHRTVAKPRLAPQEGRLMTAKDKNKAETLGANLPTGGNSVSSPELPCKKKRPKLSVKVYCLDDGNKKPIYAKVKANARSKSTGKKSGLAEFGTVAPGDYTVVVENFLSPDDKDFAAPAASQTITLALGDDKTVEIIVERKNIVTPKIEMEYKVVLLDRRLTDHQDVTEPTKFYADPTYIELSFTEKYAGLPDKDYQGTHHFEKGGVFTAPNVDIFLDENCTTNNKLPSNGQLTNDQLGRGKKLKLYLKGKTAGPFTAELTLNDPGDGFIQRDKNPAQGEMGVVELKLIPHQHDTVALAAIQVNPDTDPVSTYHTNLFKKVLPAQKELTDVEKVKPGRVLHVQNTASFGRARLLVKKLEASQWPAGTDNYKITLNETNTTGTTGSCAVHGKEWDAALKPLPLEIRVSDLKVADKEFWVEGKTASSKALSIRLDLGLNRDPGGLEKTAKQNGDWARFTVVKINEVKLDYTPPIGGASAWDPGQKQFYINLVKPDPNGRKVTIGARLTEPIKDVTVHFMLAPDKNNMKAANWGVDLPTTWKWNGIAAAVKHLDKTDRKNLLHLSAKTDVTGYAKTELTLSRFGGDKFRPAAYIDQDPHLAKYVHGYPKLEKRKPVFAADTITVWRKFWYQEIKVQGVVVAGFFNAADTYKAVKVVMEAIPAIEMSRADADAINPRVIYPKYMLSYYVDSSNNYRNNYKNNMDAGLMVGDATESRFFVLAAPMADKPVMIPMLNANGLWIAGNNTSAVTIPWFRPADLPKKTKVNAELLDPPLQGGTLLDSGDWQIRNWDPIAHAWVDGPQVALLAADIDLDPNRDDPHEVRIKAPAGLVIGAQTEIRIINLTLRGAERFLGTSYPDGIVNSYTPNDEQDFINTINHELGHSFKQVAKIYPGGIPKHPHQYDHDGSHCKYVNKKCLMYESGPQPAALNRYCPVCHAYVLVQDMTK